MQAGPFPIGFPRLLIPEHFHIISLELFNALIGQGVLDHLLDHLEGYRGNVAAGERALGHMG